MGKRFAVIELIVGCLILVMAVAGWAKASGLIDAALLIDPSLAYSGTAVQEIWSVAAGMFIYGLVAGALIVDACHKLRK